MQVNSHIAAVTVFADRAKVIRTADVEALPAGESSLVLENLPAGLLPDSVRVKGQGSVGIRILGIDVRLVPLARTPAGTVADLQAQLEQLELRKKELADATSGEELRLKMMSAMRRTASKDMVKGLAWGRSGIDAIDALSVYADKTDKDSRALLRDLAVQVKTVQKEIEAVSARLRQFQQPVSEKRRSVSVAVDSNTEGASLQLEVSYVCNGATWIPLYDARLSGDKVRITYLASVTQNTGEDWPETKLSLSTARPAVTTEIPELRPWYVDVFVPPPVRPQAPMAMQSAGSAPGEFTRMFSSPAPAPMASMPPPPQAAEPVMAEVVDNGASATFHIPRRTSIPSDNTPHRAQIAEFELPATLDYITAPKIAEQAYLRATVRNQTSFVLLKGKANLFHNDEFVGTTTIQDTAAREFELQMGVDERVTVTRELVSREVAKAFIGSSRRTSYTYRIKIAHRLETSAKLLVLDQLPHSRHEDIKVKLLDAAPKVSEQGDLSELRWRLSLDPNKSTDVSFSFQVEYPGGHTVVGLHD